jgi:anti-sigma factor RsiW
MTSSTDQARQETTLLVHAYMDGELDTAHALTVKRQIDADPALASELAAIGELQRVLRERLPRYRAPAHLRSRIEAAVGLTHQRAHPTWRALAASVVVAIALSSGSTWLTLRLPAGDRIAEEVVDTHMRALLASKPTDVSTSDQHSVKPWFNSHIPQSPRVVDLASEGFPLVGARIDVIETIPVPTLVYNRRLHVISLYAIPAASGLKGSPMRRSINGFNLVDWSDDGTTYWATSDLNLSELETFVRLFQTASK